MLNEFSWGLYHVHSIEVLSNYHHMQKTTHVEVLVTIKVGILST